MNDKIRCSCCGGSGEVDLPEHLQSTLRVVRTRGPITAREFVDGYQGHIGITGVNNRLEDLRLLGFVTREKQGKQWLYSATKATQSIWDMPITT